jgi:L-fuconolactonase
MATQTPTIDSQVHAYERNRPERPWSGFLPGSDKVTGDDMRAGSA